MKVILYNAKRFKKSLQKIPLPIQERVLEAIESLINFPKIDYNVKRLYKFALANYRLRIGDHRILFDFQKDNETVVVFDVLHRKDSYKP